MREFEDKYRVDRTSQILTSENAFRDDVDLRLHQLETASQTLAQAANEARDQIVRSADLEIAPRVAQMATILAQFEGNANALRDAVLTIVRDGVATRGDTLKKLLDQVDAATSTASALAASFSTLAAQLDSKANANHGHDLSAISGAAQALDGKLSKGANLSDLQDATAARQSLGFTWNYPGGTLPSYVWMSSDGVNNRPYPIGNAANQIPFINSNTTLEIKSPSGVTNYSFLTYTSGLQNFAGFYQTSNNRQYMVLQKADGTLGTRFTSDGDTDIVQGYPFYPTRAWVRFNGIGTPTVLGSGNISSITKNGPGDYTLNFATPMPDANYSVVATGQTHTSGGHQAGDNVFMSIYNGASITQNSVRINSQLGNANSGVDMATVCVTITR